LGRQVELFVCRPNEVERSADLRRLFLFMSCFEIEELEHCQTEDILRHAELPLGHGLGSSVTLGSFT